MAKIPDHLRTWLATNIVNGCTLEQLKPTLLQHGVAEKDADEELKEAFKHPYITAARLVKEQLNKREWLLNTLDWHQRHLQNYSTPKKVPLPPFKQFLEEYYYANKIGIFSGAIDHWKALKWTLPDLVDIVGYDSVVQVQAGREKDPNYEINRDKYNKDMKFGDFIKKITSLNSSNDIYMTANNHPFKNPAMRKLLDGFGNIGDGYFDMSRMETSAFIWLGPKGVITPLHHDLTNNFFIQIHGKKIYHLIPPMQAPYMYDTTHVYSDVKLMEPNLKQYPDFAKANIIEVELNPGDFLFIPIGCWHHVAGITANISMTLINVNERNEFPGFPSVTNTYR